MLVVCLLKSINDDQITESQRMGTSVASAANVSDEELLASVAHIFLVKSLESSIPFRSKQSGIRVGVGAGTRRIGVGHRFLR